MSNAKSTSDILLQVESLKAAIEFYRTKLGFHLFMDTPAMAGLETGAFRLFLEPRPPLGPVLEFLVENLQEQKHALIGAGCQIFEDDPSIPRCYVRDPFGLIFDLGQR